MLDAARSGSPPPAVIDLARRRARRWRQVDSLSAHAGRRRLRRTLLGVPTETAERGVLVATYVVLAAIGVAARR